MKLRHKSTFVWFTVFLFILLAALPTFAQDESINLSGVEPTALTEEMLADLDAYIADALGRYHTPGASVAVVQNGEVIYVNGFGVHEMGEDAPVKSDTLFMIGSLPKSMTAMMIGTLVDEGLVTWDTPIVDVLPSFVLENPESTRTVTFRDLLSMRSGLPRFDIPLFMQLYSPEQIIESLANLPLNAAPGESYAYSNQGYAAAGFIAAIAAGAKYSDDVYETYARLMQERVYDPIGMQHITLDFDAGANSDNVASPHSFNLATGGFSPSPFEIERGGFSVIPAGGTTWATAEDLARYLITQMNHGVTPDGERIITEENLLETWKPTMPVGDGTHFGLGWIIEPDYHGLSHIDYTGGNVGYSSYLSFLPDANLGVVVLTNRAVDAGFIRAVAEYVFESTFGLEHTADATYSALDENINGLVAQISSTLETQVDPEAVADFLGDYERGISVRLNEGGEFTLATVFGDFPLYAVSGQKDTFAIGLTIGLNVQFAEDEAGNTSLTIIWDAGEPQPPLTLTKMGT